MDIQPLQNRVIVKRQEEEKTTSYGFVLNTADNDKPDYGEVVAIGEGNYGISTGVLIPMSVKIGDKIMFSKSVGQPIKINGQDMLSMREDDIIGIVTN